jgi:hypothetical protein
MRKGNIILIVIDEYIQRDPFSDSDPLFSVHEESLVSCPSQLVDGEA